MALGDITSKATDKFVDALAGSSFRTAIGWLVLLIIIFAVAGFGVWWYFEKKKYNKNIVAHGIIHGFFHPTGFKDIAKSIKLGKGGFEVLYLRKLKTWKLAHGARGGINDYHFYILPDGYWYPGQIGASLKQIDKDGGLLSVVTTNPTMRSQYTALEKQIETLHGQKQTFWDKYGNWIMTGTYIALIGIFSWLSWREIAGFLGSGGQLADKMNALADSMSKLAVNLDTACRGGSGLVKP